jgi:hypothetical protein
MENDPVPFESIKFDMKKEYPKKNEGQGRGWHEAGESSSLGPATTITLRIRHYGAGDDV